MVIKTIYFRVLTLAASSEEEKDKWLEDITEAIDFSKNLPNDEKISYLSLKSCSKFWNILKLITLCELEIIHRRCMKKNKLIPPS